MEQDFGSGSIQLVQKELFSVVHENPRGRSQRKSSHAFPQIHFWNAVRKMIPGTGEITNDTASRSLPLQGKKEETRSPSRLLILKEMGRCSSASHLEKNPLTSAIYLY